MSYGRVLPKVGVVAALAMLTVVVNAAGQGRGGANCSACSPTDFNKSLGKPFYLIHDTGHGTTSGGVKDDAYLLYPQEPNAKGDFTMADGFGGTIGYSSDYHSGALSTPAEVCKAAKARGLKAQEWTPYNRNESFDCNCVSCGGGGPSAPDAGEGGGPAAGGNGWGPPQCADPPQLNAEIQCQTDPFIIAISELPSRTCNIWISCWRRDTSEPVNVILPNALDAAGNDTSGIQVNTGSSDQVGAGVAPSNLSGFKGPDGSYDQYYPWGITVFACPAQKGTGANCDPTANTAVGAFSIPIQVVQGDGRPDKQEVDISLDGTAGTQCGITGDQDCAMACCLCSGTGPAGADCCSPKGAAPFSGDPKVCADVVSGSP